MGLSDQICSALCKGFKVRGVPMGFAIASPFDWFTGDKMVFYARTKGSLVRFEDDGSTIFELEGAGVDLTSNTRLEQLRELCRENSVEFDEEESTFYTDYVNHDEVGLAAIRFMAFMVRVQDLLLTVTTRVASTFKDDLIAAVQGRFQGEGHVSINDAPVPALSYYTVDIVVRHNSGKLAAIFPATSEEKALSATLFAKELELKHIDNVVPFLVFENAAGSKVGRDTQAKAMNSELQLATWEGAHADVLDKISRHVR
jgi:hypothetical protein